LFTNQDVELGYTVLDMLFLLGDPCASANHKEPKKIPFDAEYNCLDRTSQLLISIALAVTRVVKDQVKLSSTKCKSLLSRHAGPDSLK